MARISISAATCSRPLPALFARYLACPRTSVDRTTAGAQPWREHVLMRQTAHSQRHRALSRSDSHRANARMRSASSFETTVRPECDMRRATRDLAVAAGGCGRTGCTPPARSLAERWEYLLRHALELAFLVVSGDPEQDSGRSGLDVSL